MKKLFLAAALVACASVVHADSNTVLHATLSGASVVDGGDPDGSGQFTLSIRGDEGQFCYNLAISNVSNAGDAHIHEGASGEVGRPVIDLDVGEHCGSIDENTLNQIISNPSDYYVDVLSSAYHKGAVRGQLTN